MSSRLFDLAVVGGGIIGLAHAYMAAKAGKRVAVIEKDVRANGASIRNFGFITVTGQERGDIWRLARRTRDVWAEVAAAAGLQIDQRGLYLTARSAEAVAVIDAFLATEMGEGCRLMAPDEFRRAAHGLGSSDLEGALFSPHELRVESRDVIPALAAWLEKAWNVTFFNRDRGVRGVTAPSAHLARRDRSGRWWWSAPAMISPRFMPSASPNTGSAGAASPCSNWPIPAFVCRAP